MQVGMTSAALLAAGMPTVGKNPQKEALNIIVTKRARKRKRS